MPDFIRTRDTNFQLGGENFFALGVNCYFLGFCTEEVQVSILQQVAAAGMNTIRAWAFCDVLCRKKTESAFQFFADGKIQFNDGPSGLERLDTLIENAERSGIYLLLPLLNNWPDFGGLAFYQSALNLPACPAAFFGSQVAQDAYKQWVEHLLTRRNTRTGRLYIDEPAIFAWELANEPRCPNSGGSSILLEWVHEMSFFLKQLDINHLLAVGDEGFFRKGGLSHLYDGRYGTDAEAFLKLPSIDFGTFHLYPEHWGVRPESRAVEKWIADHLVISRLLNKPVLMEEFGTTHSARDALYGRWMQQLREHGGAGALVWMLGSQHPQVVDFQDKYTLFEAKSLSYLNANA